MRKDDGETIFYGYNRGNPVSPWPRRLLVGFACSYTIFKICAVPTKLHWDLRMSYKEYDNKTDNETLASCQQCLDLAIDNQFPQEVFVEMTSCYRKFADVVNVTKPKTAVLGNDVESWKTSFESYGDDWWDQYPLDRCPTRFDNRVLFPKWNHQSMLLPELFWGDWVVACLMFSIACTLVAMVVLEMTASRTCVVLSSVVYMVFSPYFTHRLAQSYSWEMDSNECVRVYYENDQFTSLHFYMLACWYASMLMMFAPVAAKWHNAGSRAEDEVEGIAALIVLAITSSLSLTMSLVNIDNLRSRAPVTHYHMFNDWEGLLILAVVDCIPVVLVMWFFYRCLEIKDVRRDQVVPIF